MDQNDDDEEGDDEYVSEPDGDEDLISDAKLARPDPTRSCALLAPVPIAASLPVLRLHPRACARVSGRKKACFVSPMAACRTRCSATFVAKKTRKASCCAKVRASVECTLHATCMCIYLIL